LAPSPVAFADGWHTPREATEADLSEIVAQFKGSALRAARLDVDLLEVHMAHGYLINQFLSPLTNHRADGYGGSREGRFRFALQVFAAVRAVWPAGRALGAKIPGSDYAPGGLTADDAVALARELQKRGADYVTVSGGGLVANQQLPGEMPPNVPFAARVRQEAGLSTGVVGFICGAEQADGIVRSGQADFVVLARAFLFDPRWAWHAAAKLGVELGYPPQYDRSKPSNWAAGKALTATF
jgi:NADPH2 dehydrogenase